MDNLPRKFTATLRHGAMFGPVTFRVTGIDLTQYTLSAGIGPTDVAPTLARVNATTFTMHVPPSAMAALLPRGESGLPSGMYTLWIDATSVSDPQIVIPIVGGVLTVVPKGAHD